MESANEIVTNRFSEMSKFGEGEIIKEDEANCIGLILFKPDATKTRLDLPIYQYIEQVIEKTTGKQVKFFAFTQVNLNKEKIDQLYPNQTNTKYLKYIEDHLTSGPVYLTLVLSKDAPQILNKIKGSVKNDSGVRGSFASGKAISEEKLKQWQSGQLDADETQKIGTELFAANLIHVPDDKFDTKHAISLLYPPQEITDMEKAIPIFARWFNN